MAVTWNKVAYEDDVILNTVADANSVLYSVTDDTPAALAMGASTFCARLAAGDIVAATVGEVQTLLNVAAGATADAKATGAEVDTGTDDDKFATAKALIDSHNVPSVAPGTATNVLTSDGTDWTSAAAGAPGAHKDTHDPEDGVDPLDCAAPLELAGIQAAAEGSSHSFARSDHAHQIQESFADNHIVTVNDAGVAENEMARFTSTGGVEGITYATLAAAIALDDVGVPDAAVDFDLQQATDLVVMTVANEAALPAANVALGQLCWATGELSLHVCTSAA